MKKHHTPYPVVLLALGLGTLAISVFAQPTNPRHPVDPGAATAAGQYRSVFSDYQSFKEQKPVSWK
ncbi:MAG: hypothetical protein H0U63_07355, partial [Burkholderiales bacterium]|nr:hypothetical protein [Burkholderiales bacterium]